MSRPSKNISLGLSGVQADPPTAARNDPEIKEAMPAMRPVPSRNAAVAAPINSPPSRDCPGVKRSQAIDMSEFS
jgi:hypothetical protein